ncbi:hypothetical protein [Corallococcus sp. Z5C101001]|uniref:hypothetical protein n=1 Tax=Corallococcus sp. Z5C101001 TaxID=2596829 RepID=UPI0011807150|nr:hypothetical protein [Corallococcus sp. Z5C101001]TSC27501.1 hypothetical protein FOF48_18915 [Corallococcus sp. Z5C101001]
MGNVLHIVASCTDRKRLPVPETLHLRHIRGAQAEVRANTWWHQLQSHMHPLGPVQELYAGEHWSVVLGLPTIAHESGFKPNLWVASAGYGLIPNEALVRPYSATFARGHADSVARDAGNQDMATQLRRWWGTLSSHAGPAPHHARTIRQLASEQSNSSILVVASPLYIAAISDDLEGAANALQHPERLLVVSSPAPLSKGLLAPHWIPSSAHHQQRLGGSRLGLHARVAREILLSAQGARLDAAEAQSKYQNLIKTSDPIQSYDRQPMTDDELRTFIRQVMDEGTKSWSAALRQLRGRQFACEQRRFKSLFVQVQENS